MFMKKMLSAFLGIVVILLSTTVAMAERTGDVPINKAAQNGALAGLETTDLNTLTPEDLVNTITGAGITIVPGSVEFNGNNIAAGTFTGGTGIIGIESGIILSSGNIASVKGPNKADGTTTSLGTPGDDDLNGLISGSTLDATVLEFDFVPTSDVVSFSYVFGSEEYNEYVDSFNDVFGFFVNGQNVALIPGTTTVVSINNVNSGNPFDITGATGDNPAYYLNNDLNDGGGAINTELDGLTVVLTINAPVNANQQNHIKLAIADAGDSALDSDVFIRGGSFTPHVPECSDQIDNDGDGLTDFPNDPGCDTPADDSEQDITPVPEFPTIALPIVSIMGILFLISRQKKN